MRAFVTGHTGFKGTWLLHLLQELNAEVVGYALPPEEGALFTKAQTDVPSHFADIRDRERLKRALLEFQPTVIFHLAAQALVLSSYENPVETFETNLLGTTYLLEAVRALQGPCHVIIVTSDKVYRPNESLLLSEEDALGGSDPYSSSKAGKELIVSSYRDSFFQDSNKKLFTARSGNVIGGGDRAPHRLFPDLIRSLEKGEPLLIRSPKAVRPWQHVLEPLAGYLALAKAEKPGSYNFGPRDEDHLTVEEMVKEALHFMGRGSYQSIDAHKRETAVLKLTSEKAKKELGWQPKWSAKRAIAETLSWHFDGASDPRGWMQKQIRDYLNGGSCSC